MNRPTTRPFAFAFAACTLAGAIFAPGTSPAAPVDFAKDVAPVLESNCIRCHGSGKEKGGLRLHTREAMLKGGESDYATLVPGKAEESELVARVCLPEEDNDFMPQEAKPLKPAEIAALKAWINAGAEWPEGIRLKPAKEQKKEIAQLFKDAPRNAAETAARIDALIAADNDAAGIQATAPVGDLAFHRRATLDLIGRVPSEAELRAFEAASPGGRREELVDRLIGDPRFAGRWSVFFADMLRVRANAEGGNQLLAWLNRSLAEEKPYDEMVRELISANGKPGANPAVGFILADNAEPMALAGATAQIFLGTRVACAECHDHPFDDWERMDFYQLAAFFGKTQRVESRFSRTVYTTEGKEMRVQWPPEDTHPASQKPVEPEFPFELSSFDGTPSHIARLEKKRAKAGAPGEAAPEEALDDLLDGPVKVGGGKGPDILAEAKKESAALDVKGDLYRASELREKLANYITDPRNTLFARAFVNRVWAELVGRGFVEPLDNFSQFNDPKHTKALEYLSREFIASGFDFRELVRAITLTDAYRRSHPEPGLSEPEREKVERAFAAAPLRRMVSEVLYDSIVIAGHLEDQKWRSGENLRTVERQIRVPIEGEKMGAAPAAASAGGSGDDPKMMMAADASMKPMPGAAGYDLEKTIALDFDELLKKSADDAKEIAAMKEMSDRKIEEAKMAEMRAQQRAAQQGERYRLETVEEKVDDNPQFDSALRMASPAPADHFLRVFGQPSREGLGEFRDHSSSLRQELMMLNGRATHEAARVGSLEPMAKLLGEKPNLDGAARLAYREILSRNPSAAELAEATALLSGAPTPEDGMADLRWALFNCHEFRFLP
ncbi:MAG: DUF1553 domain-containing protein [Verrucomicrobiales bacterium]